LASHKTSKTHQTNIKQAQCDRITGLYDNQISSVPVFPISSGGTDNFINFVVNRFKDHTIKQIALGSSYFSIETETAIEY
jgi:hypothetical protein